MFSEKKGSVDWGALSQVDLDKLQRFGDQKEEEKLFALQDMIIKVELFA